MVVGGIGGTLEVDGKYTDPNNNNNWGSVFMTGGSVQLSGGCSLWCSSDYFQTGGTLETMDDLQEAILDQTKTRIPGTMTVAGGYVKIAQSQGQTQYGSLLIVCNSLEFAGTYAPKISAAMSGQQDSLIINGVLNLNAGSNLQVTVVGTLDPAKKGTEDWTIIEQATNQLNKFANNNDNTTGLTEKPNQPNNGYYQLIW